MHLLTNNTQNIIQKRNTQNRTYITIRMHKITIRIHNITKRYIVYKIKRKHTKIQPYIE